MKTLAEVWAEAEKLFQGVHVDKIGNNNYSAQVNRRGCVCDRCSCERTGPTPVSALERAIADLSAQPLHVEIGHGYESRSQIILCDACNVRPEWKGEHRCHTANGQKEMLVSGKRVYEFCGCSVCVPIRLGNMSNRNNRNSKELMDEVKIKKIEYPDANGGISLSAESPAFAVLAMECVKLFKDQAAINYCEWKMNSGDPAFGTFTVVIQREAGETPAQQNTRLKEELRLKELQIDELKQEEQDTRNQYTALKHSSGDRVAELNELIMLVVPQHLWLSSGARISDHDDCETCDWLEKNTKFGEKSKTEKRNDVTACPSCGMAFTKTGPRDILCRECERA